MPAPAVASASQIAGPAVIAAGPTGTAAGPTGTAAGPTGTATGPAGTADPAASIATLSAGPLRDVSFLGYRTRVPASWTVVDLRDAPATCVRFDRHVVYLGSPGPAEQCPAHLIAATTEALLIEPARMPGAPSATRADPAAHQYLVTDAAAGVEIIATYGSDRALILAILADAPTLAGGLAAGPPGARPGQAREPGARAAGVIYQTAMAAARPGVDRTARAETSGSVGLGHVTARAATRSAAARGTPPLPAPFGIVPEVTPGSTVPSSPTPMPSFPPSHAPYAPVASPPAAAPAPTASEPPAAAPAPTASEPPAAPLPGWVTNDTGLGFDTCAAPGAAAMSAWLARSPYRAIGIYVGGGDRACAQPNLTAGWVRQQAAAGWHFIPLYVGPQAAFHEITDAFGQGVGSADDAVSQAAALGFGPGTPLYYDMEAYPRRQRGRALALLSAWTLELHRLGYASGVYSSADSAVADLARNYTGYAMPDVIYVGRWNGVAGTDDPVIPAGEWADHRRIHQFRGGVNRKYGGYRLNIDRDYLDVRLPAGFLSGEAATVLSPPIGLTPQPAPPVVPTRPARPVVPTPPAHVPVMPPPAQPPDMPTQSTVMPTQPAQPTVMPTQPAQPPGMPTQPAQPPGMPTPPVLPTRPPAGQPPTRLPADLLPTHQPSTRLTARPDGADRNPARSEWAAATSTRPARRDPSADGTGTPVGPP